MPLAEPSDVLSRLGRAEFTLEEAALVDVRLADVERMIRRRIPDLATRVADEDFLADVVQVESDAVLRLARNPDGYMSETDGNYTYMLQTSLSTGELEIRPKEWATLGVVDSQGFSILIPNVVMPT